MEQRSDSLDGFGRGIYVHTFEFAGFDPAAGLRRFLGFRRLLFLLSSLFVDGVMSVRTAFHCACKAVISNIYRQRFLLPFQVLDLLGDRVFRANTLR